MATHPDDFLGLLHLYSERGRMPTLATGDGILRFLAGPEPRLVVTRSMPFPRPDASGVVEGLPPNVRAVRAGSIGAREILLLHTVR